MRHIYVFTILYALSMNVYAKTITLNIPDDEIKIVENDVVDAEQWIKDAWKGKVNNCKKRLIKKEVDLSISKGESLPAGEAAVVQKYFSRPDYKSRKEKDLGEKGQVK